MNWQAIGSIGSALAAISALVFLLVNIRLLNRTLQANINGPLLQQSTELLRYIATNPYLYDYFYNSQLLSDTDEHKVEVLCVCVCAKCWQIIVTLFLSCSTVWKQTSERTGNILLRIP
jgi:hypothetical protein